MSEKGRTRDFISGMVWGGLMGATAALLMAPRSGEETRSMLRNQTEELRRKAMDAAEQTKAKAGELQERGRELIEANRERIVRTAGAAQEAAKVTWMQSGLEHSMTGELAQPQSTPQTTGPGTRQPGIGPGR